MDYEQKYKAALGWMQSLYNGLHGATREDAEHFFPELKDNDERIKRNIIAALKGEGYYDCDLTNECIAWLDKQVFADDNEIVEGVRRGVAISLINHIDANSKGMCLSSMECEDIENAIINEDWDKVYRYMKKKLEKQGKQEPFDYENATIIQKDFAPKVESKFKVGN